MAQKGSNHIDHAHNKEWFEKHRTQRGVDNMERLIFRLNEPHPNQWKQLNIVNEK